MIRSALTCYAIISILTATGQSDTQAWRHFHLQELIVEQVTKQKRYLPFLDEGSISAGIYELRTHDEDRQQPHLMDEIYFILNGKSRFNVESQTTTLEAGDVLFVRAGLDHKFLDISEDLRTLVWFSGSKNTDHDFYWKKWSAPHKAIPRLRAENTWDVFLEVPTMVAGVYSLPARVGGDSVLTHKEDEINYVVKGRAKFAIGEEEIEVSPGSVIYIKAGTGHRFFDLVGDFQAYIMFVQ
ncbi:MAG: cupin domain-containing protein [Cyclobacteriaceae bacterium]|nr:cupin domain-containing protein [Cyclobacteriaceae bacterium]